MKDFGNNFGQLLTEGLYAIKLQEGKPLNIIQDELGFAIGRDSGGSALAHWRRGNIPTSYKEVENLLRHMVRRGNLGKAWVEQLISQTDYSVEAICDALSLNSESTAPLKNTMLNFPGKDYRQLVGREQLTEEVLSLLAAYDIPNIVSIDGQGGIGKTALTLYIANSCQRKGLFERYIWLSAAGNLNENRFSLETILDFVGLELGEETFANMSLTEKKRLCQEYLTNNRTLLVLDNLETAAQPQDEIIKQLQPLLGQSKVIATSRRRIRHNSYSIHLVGLEEKGAAHLIQQCGLDKGIHHVQDVASEEVEAIMLATGGSPLAIQLVVSQLHHLPLPLVLKGLSEITPLAQISDEGEYTKFYRYIFQHSWELLNRESKSLLVTMAQFVSTNGANFEAIQHVSELNFDTLLGCIETLWDSSLLEIRNISGVSQIRYYLHPLTHNFVLSDIARVL